MQAVLKWIKKDSHLDYFGVLLLYWVNIFRNFLLEKIAWCLIKISIEDWLKIWTIWGSYLDSGLWVPFIVSKFQFWKFYFELAFQKKETKVCIQHSQLLIFCIPSSKQAV